MATTRSPREPQARELTDGSKAWTLKIANSGGPGNSPALTLINDELGVLESSRSTVSGDHMLLPEQECASGPPVLQRAYRWKLSADTRALTEVRNGCKDDVALTVLTARSWREKSH